MLNRLTLRRMRPCLIEEQHAPLDKPAPRSFHLKIQSPVLMNGATSEEAFS